MGLGIPPFKIEIMLASNPLKSMMLVRRLAVSEKGEVLLRGIGTLRYLFPQNACVQWQPDGLTSPRQKVAPRSRIPYRERERDT